jgi:hypothetical protein
MLLSRRHCRRLAPDRHPGEVRDLEIDGGGSLTRHEKFDRRYRPEKASRVDHT